VAQGNAFGGMGKMSELKNRLLFLLGALIIFRLGAHIPVPGIDPNELKKLFDAQSGGILGLFNVFGWSFEQIYGIRLGYNALYFSVNYYDLVNFNVRLIERIKKRRSSRAKSNN